ncbi:diaminopimelate epimerase [Alphaproteobacteria bacterium]|jgi:diaminopimelate epimerase|nr:diaminopimelate epimerase [Alphaproteobacteria bacterium]|tara:strand:- start:437 stop:1264 length:828 start_codon:yes stop_codon:yes gene_type:complete
MKKPFIKMHGLGNDFVVIDSTKNQYTINKSSIQLISDRRFGVGCDQVIEMKPSAKEDIYMKIYNSDGTEAEACGNAARCVAGLLFASNQKKEVSIETVAGVLKAESEEDGLIKVDMGKPSFFWKDIPLSSDISHISFEELSLINGLAVNMGNPHIVFFVKDINEVDINKVGPLVENSSYFPEKVNVEVCQIINKSKIKVTVWERGAGKTLACGTGACAALVAAYKNNLTDPTAEIVLNGGSLNITWNVNSDEHVIMSGPIAVSFLGDFSTLGIEK